MKKQQQNLYEEIVKVSGPYSVVRNGKYYGIMSRNRIICDLRLISIPKIEQLFFYELCSVETEAGCMLINSEGRIVIHDVYQEIDVENEELVVLKEMDGTYRFFFPQIPSLCEGIFSNDTFDAYYLDRNFIKTFSNSLQGAYSYKGHELLNPEFKCVNEFSEEILEVTKSNNKKFLFNEKWFARSQNAFEFYNDLGVITGFIYDKVLTIDPETGKTISTKRTRAENHQGKKKRLCVMNINEMEIVAPQTL